MPDHKVGCKRGPGDPVEPSNAKQSETSYSGSAQVSSPKSFTLRFSWAGTPSPGNYGTNKSCRIPRQTATSAIWWLSLQLLWAKCTTQPVPTLTAGASRTW